MMLVPCSLVVIHLMNSKAASFCLAPLGMPIVQPPTHDECGGALSGPCGRNVMPYFRSGAYCLRFGSSQGPIGAMTTFPWTKGFCAPGPKPAEKPEICVASYFLAKSVIHCSALTLLGWLAVILLACGSKNSPPKAQPQVTIEFAWP